MKLVSNDPIEFRRMTSSTGQNGTNYYYHFEDDDNGAFQLWSKKEFGGLEKGKMYTLTFSTRLWDNKLQFNLEGVSAYGGK